MYVLSGRTTVPDWCVKYSNPAATTTPAVTAQMICFMTGSFQPARRPATGSGIPVKLCRILAMGAPVRRHSYLADKVLGAFADRPGEPLYGYQILKAIDRRGGSLYPLLDRMVTEGLLTAEPEQTNPRGNGRPPRKWYRLTEAGAAAAAGLPQREVPLVQALDVLTARARELPADVVTALRGIVALYD